MMHVQHPASSQANPSPPHPHRVAPLGNQLPFRSHPPRYEQPHHFSTNSIIHGHGQGQGRGRSGRKPQGLISNSCSKGARRANTAVEPHHNSSLNHDRPHVQALCEASNGGPLSYRHDQDAFHDFDGNCGFGSFGNHHYSAKPSGYTNPLMQPPPHRHSRTLYGLSSRPPYPGGMAIHHVNSEATPVPYMFDQTLYPGHEPGHQQQLADKRYTRTHQPYQAHVPYYTTPGPAPLLSTTHSSVASPCPSYRKPVVAPSSPMVPMGPYPPPWGYMSYAPPPPPPSLSSGYMSHYQPLSSFQDKLRPSHTDNQDDVEVVLGDPDRVCETDSTASGSSGVRHMEVLPDKVDQGRGRLRDQLEWYFSPRNLLVDRYLLSQMDDEQYVPISVIADFKMVKALTSDYDEIVEVLRRSPMVIVNEAGTLVKPNIVKRPRTTLILRDLPVDTTEDEIRQIFELQGQCPPQLVTKEVGNNWFVDFATEEEAQAMLAFTRGKSIRDVPIAGRLKSNTALAGLDFRTHHPSFSTQHPWKQSSQEASREWSLVKDVNDDTSCEGVVPYRRFPADENSYIPEEEGKGGQSATWSSSEEGTVVGGDIMRSTSSLSTSSTQQYSPIQQASPPRYSDTPLDHSWITTTQISSHEQGCPPHDVPNTILYPPPHQLPYAPTSNGAGGRDTCSSGASIQRNNDSDFGTNTNRRRTNGENRKPGRKSGQQQHQHQSYQQQQYQCQLIHLHQQYHSQQPYRRQLQKRGGGMTVAERRRNSFSTSTKHHRNVHYHPDRSEGLVPLPGDTQRMVKAFLPGKSFKGQQKQQRRQEQALDLVASPAQDEPYVYAIESLVDGLKASVSSVPHVPRQKVSHQQQQQQDRQDHHREQSTLKPAHKNRSSQACGEPQGHAAADSVEAAERLVSTENGLPQSPITTVAKASSFSTATTEDLNERNELDASITKLSTIVSQIALEEGSYLSGDGKSRLDRFPKRTGNGENQAKQAGPSSHSSPPSVDAANLLSSVLSSQVSTKDGQPLSLTKADMRSAKNHPKNKHQKQQQHNAKDQTKGKNCQPQQRQRQQRSLHHSTGPSELLHAWHHSSALGHHGRDDGIHRQRTTDRLHSRGIGDGSLASPSKTTVPSFSDETIFPPMVMATPVGDGIASTSARPTASSIKLSTSFSYAVALKQPLLLREPNTPSTSESF